MQEGGKVVLRQVWVMVVVGKEVGRVEMAGVTAGVAKRLQQIKTTDN